jgi:hypothetical protein
MIMNVSAVANSPATFFLDSTMGYTSNIMIRVIHYALPMCSTYVFIYFYFSFPVWNSEGSKVETKFSKLI